MVGGFVGSVVGYMAGSKIGEAVYEGGKAIGKAIVDIAEGAANVAKGAWNFITSPFRLLA